MKKEVSKGKRILSTALCIVVIFITFIFIVAIFSDNSSSVNNSPSTSGYEYNTTQEETQLESNAGSISFIDTTEQSNDKWKMTFKECQIKNELDLLTSAEDGAEFVIAYFEIENISGEAQNFSLFNTDFYFDGVKTPQTIYGVFMNNSFQLTDTLVEPGRKANGYFLFQVSSNWNKLEIIYNEDLLKEANENVMKFTLTK